MAEYLQEWTYLAVFLLSALPLVESAVIVTLAIALGLNPISSTILALAGNWLIVFLVVMLFDRLQQWRKKRRKNDETKLNHRRERAHRIFVKYGLPGLAIIGPILIGTEIAVVCAMTFKAPRKNVLIWMTI